MRCLVGRHLFSAWPVAPIKDYYLRSFSTVIRLDPKNAIYFFKMDNSHIISTMTGGHLPYPVLADSLRNRTMNSSVADSFSP